MWLTGARRHRHGPSAYCVYLAGSLARCLVATRKIRVIRGSIPEVCVVSRNYFDLRSVVAVWDIHTR